MKMVSADDPYIKVEYHDGTGWQDITDYMKKKKGFVIEDAGLSEVGRLKLTLKCLDLALGHHIKVIADVGQGQHLIFYGRLVKCVARTIGGKSDTCEVEVTAYNMLERLVNDTITWNYYDEQAPLGEVKWSYKSVIEDFLSNPDSSFDTGFTLDCGDQSTSPEMYQPVDGACNFERQTLLEALRVILETVGYDGYLKISANPIVLVRKLGTMFANPSITLNPPYVHCELANSLDNVMNIIHCKGGMDIGIPSDQDRFTEKTIERYPNSWTVDPEMKGTVSDAPNDIFGDSKIGDYCIKIEYPSETGVVSTTAWFNPEAVLGTGNYLDMEHRIARVNFLFYLEEDGHVEVYLRDVNNRTIYYRTEYGPVFKAGQVHLFDAPTKLGGADIYDATGTNPAQNNKWNAYSEDVLNNFDWSQIKQVGIHIDESIGGGVGYIDGLLFGGAYEIDPFKHPDMNPAVYDEDSVNMYGVRLMWINDTSIRSFEQANAEKTRVLNNLKDPIPTLTIKTNTAFTWLKPNQCITVNVPQFGISNETWRPAKVIHVYRNGRLRTHLELVKQTDMIPPLWAKQPFLYPFIK